MSFMFNPFPYDDPDAINKIPDFTLKNKEAFFGNKAVGNELIKKIKEVHSKKGACAVGIDGYITAPFDKAIEVLTKDLGISLTVLSVSEIFKPSEILDEKLSEYLPTDKDKDPVSLYGKIFEGSFEDLFDDKKLSDLTKKIKNCNGIVIVYGNGSLCDTLLPLYDLKTFIDVTPKQAVLNIKKGGHMNLGSAVERPFKVTMRRTYYVDFELAFKLRWKLLKNALLDFYIAGTKPDELYMLSYSVTKEIFEKGIDSPFRCRPVYLEGVWGGYLVKKERKLPAEMKNCAWVFDLIPMEVSVVYNIDGKELEFPFYTLIQTCGEKLMGKICMEKFGGYFPIRFNYDDTFHSNGNMSIQLHPGEKFLKENANELGRQDESYYIVETGQGAKTFLGFNNDADPDEFLSDIKRSEKEHTPVDYEKYINHVKSVPGVQVMIPAGTIHASGRNQLILEIGSLTVGSYTYKMYDYLRKDLDGVPRPIHSYYGSLNINKSANKDWVESNIVQKRRTVRSGKDGDCFYEECIVGEHELLYFSLRNLIFNEKIEDNTDGYFHVLTLVDGEGVTVRSKADHKYCYNMNYLDMIVVPACVGEYEIINKFSGSVVTIHKTLLAKR